MVRSADVAFIILSVGETDPNLQVPFGTVILQYVEPSNPKAGFPFSYNSRTQNTGDKASDQFKVEITLPNGIKSWRSGIFLEPGEYVDVGIGNLSVMQPGTYEFKAKAFVGEDLTDSKSLSVQVFP